MDRTRKLTGLLVCLSLLFVCSAAADDVLVEKQISTALAAEAAVAALQQCRNGGFQVAVAVVDRAGIAKVILRDDNAGPSTVDASRRKAFTAVTFRTPTLQFAQLVADNPALQGLRDIADVLILGGGLPIRAGNEVIGGIGVSGAPGADLDEACAQAGINQISNRLQ